MSKDDIVSGLRAQLPSGGNSLDLNDDLLVTGILDSSSFLDFIAAAEERFGVTLPDEIVFGDKFNTLSQMADAISGVLESTR